MLFENHWTSYSPKQTITAKSDVKLNSRGPRAPDGACWNNPRRAN